MRTDERFDGRSDDELLAAAEQDVAACEELISRYLPSLRRMAAIYRVSGADRDDLVSEGILGLWNAIRTYSAGAGASFSTYAGHCAANRMKNALKKAARIKGREDPIEDLDEPEAAGVSPEKIAIDREFIREIFEETSASMTELERNTLSLYIDGASYQDIAKILGTDRKSVDNALARVRKKLRKKFLQQ